jgi:hypothetical protein
MEMISVFARREIPDCPPLLFSNLSGYIPTIHPLSGLFNAEHFLSELFLADLKSYFLSGCEKGRTQFPFSPTPSGRICSRGFNRARFVALQNRNHLDLGLQISIGDEQNVALWLAHNASRVLSRNFNFRPPVSAWTGIEGN